MSNVGRWRAAARADGRGRVRAVAVAALVAVASDGWTARAATHPPASGRAAGPADRPGPDGDQPVGRFDRDAVETMPGIILQRPAPPDVDAMVRALTEDHQRGHGGVRSEALSSGLRALVEDPLAPPRMDAGDPDPDHHAGKPFTRHADGGREAHP